MPLFMPGTAWLGISGISLVELRTTGRTALSLIYDARLSHIDGELTLIAKDIRVPLLIDDQVVQVPVVQHHPAQLGTATTHGGNC